MSVSITAAVAVKPATELSAASCQQLPVSKAPNAGDVCRAAVTAGKHTAQAPTFDRVLSARIGAQASDGLSSAAPDTRATAVGAGDLSCGRATAKAKPAKQDEGDPNPARAVPAAEILPGQLIPANVPGTLRLSPAGLNALSADRATTSEDSLAPAQPQPASPSPAAAIPSPEIQPVEMSQNTRPNANQDAAMTLRTGKSERESLRSPAASRLERLFGPAAEPASDTTLKDATATPKSERQPNSVASEALPPTAERSSESDKSTAAMEGATTVVAELSGLPGSVGEAQPASAPLNAPPLNSKSAPDRNISPKRGPDGLARATRKPDTGITKSAQFSGNAVSGEEPSRFTMDDSSPAKTQEARPGPASAAHDGQDNTAATARAVLPEGGHATLEAPGNKEAKLPVASQSTSPAAENFPVSPAIIQNARVLERIGQSEMRLGLNSGNFGSIEVHTSVNQDHVGASIVASHAELRAALVADMPSLEHAIAQHHLTLDSLNVGSRTDTQAGSSGAFSGGHAESQSGPRTSVKISTGSEDTAAQEAAPPPAWIAPYSSGLNVHA